MERIFINDSSCGLSDNGKSLRHDVIQSLALFQKFLRNMLHDNNMRKCSAQSVIPIRSKVEFFRDRPGRGFEINRI